MTRLLPILALGLTGLLVWASAITETAPTPPSSVGPALQMDVRGSAQGASLPVLAPGTSPARQQTSLRKVEPVAGLEGMSPGGAQVILAPQQRLGRLRGQIVDTEGAPARGLDIKVELEDIVAARKTPGQGEVVRTGTTDEQGRFDFTGMRTGRYHIRARRFLGLEMSYRVALTESPLEASGEALLLVLARPHLIVHVADASGEPVSPELAYDSQLWAISGPSFNRNWFPAQKLRLMMTYEQATAPFEAFTKSVRGKAIGDGEFIFEAWAGNEFTVGVLGPHTPWQPVHASIQEGGNGVHVFLTIPASVEPGSLELSFNTSKGTPIEGGLVTTVRGLDSETPLWQSDTLERSERSGREVQRISLPDGEYRISVIRSQRMRILLPPGLQGSTAELPHESVQFKTHIRGGESRALAVDLVPEARLLVRLTDTKGPIHLAYGRWDDHDSPEGLARHRGHVAISIQRKGAAPTALRFGADQPFAQGQVSGSQGSSSYFPAGTWVVRGEHRDGRRQSKSVTVAPGEELTVDLAFD